MEPKSTTLTTSTRKEFSKNKYIPADRILELHEKGLSNSEIARVLGCDKSNITRRLQKLLPEEARKREYLRNRADVFASVQRRILESVTEADIKKASLKDRVISVGILYEKERLERGQSTSNIHVLGEIYDGLSTREKQEVAQVEEALMAEIVTSREKPENATTGGKSGEKKKD